VRRLPRESGIPDSFSLSEACTAGRITAKPETRWRYARHPAKAMRMCSRSLIINEIVVLPYEAARVTSISYSSPKLFSLVRPGNVGLRCHPYMLCLYPMGE
jgi:hypothetical protein